MFEHLRAAWHQALEIMRDEGILGPVRRQIFWKRTATPVEMDLATVTSSLEEILGATGCEWIELKLSDVRAEKWKFPVASRRIQASRFLKHGWRGFAFLHGDQVIGDVWCVTPRKDGVPVSHPDLDLLGIACGEKDAYAFDMYIARDHRGKNLAAPIQRALQVTLKAEGIRKVFGYYHDDNLPALWMHRILKFKELPKRNVSRFLWFKKAVLIANSPLKEMKNHEHK